MKQTARIGATNNLKRAPRVITGNHFIFEPETLAFALRFEASIDDLALYDSLIKDIKTYGFNTPLELGVENLVNRINYLGIHAAHSYEVATGNFMTTLGSDLAASMGMAGTVLFTPFYGVRSSGAGGIIAYTQLFAAPYRTIVGQVMVDEANGGATAYGYGAVDNLNRGCWGGGYAATTAIQVKESVNLTSASYSEQRRHIVGWRSDSGVTPTYEGFINGVSIGAGGPTGNDRGTGPLGVTARWKTAGSPTHENFLTTLTLGITYALGDNSNYNAAGMHTAMQNYFQKLELPLP